MVFLQNILFFLNPKIMKHLIPFLLVLFISNALFAQDIIVTKNSEKIEAKITDVEQDCIKYKKFSYQEGPTYTIQKSEIASIIYQNGDVETFADYNQQSKSDINEKLMTGQYIDGYCTHITFQSRDLLGGGYKHSGYVIGDIIDGLSDMEIENKIRNGELVFFADRDFRDYLEKYDQETFRKMKQGIACATTGYVFTFVGIGGGVSMLCSMAINGATAVNLGLGITSLLIGVVGIPLWVGGNNICYKRVPEIYNNHYVQKQSSYSMSLDFGAVNGGVGLSFLF